MSIFVKIRRIKELESLPRFAYVLAVITTLGLCAGLYRLFVGLGSSTNLSTVFPWGLWILRCRVYPGSSRLHLPYARPSLSHPPHCSLWTPWL
jgi:hypothetical protein